MEILGTINKDKKDLNLFIGHYDFNNLKVNKNMHSQIKRFLFMLMELLLAI